MWGVERPPLNISILASYLRHNGVRAEVWDLNVEAYEAARGMGLTHFWTIDDGLDLPPMEVFHLLAGPLAGLLECQVDELMRAGAPMIGFYLSSSNRHWVQHMVELIHQADPRRMIVLGGPEALTLALSGGSKHYQVDYLVFGEGEETLLELVRRQQSGGPVGWVRGAMPGPKVAGHDELLRASGAWTPRPGVADLDQIPFPTYDQVPLSSYTTEVMPFLFSRGCVGRCVFCADRIHQPGFRCRSPEHAVAELAHHYHQHQRRIFTFNDLICNGDRHRLRRMCQQIIRQRLDLCWSSYAMINRHLTQDALRLMLRSGCYNLHFGFESASDRVLQLMRKPYTAALARQVLEHANEVGIKTSINLIVGFPGETEQDFEQTLDFISESYQLIHKVLNVSTPTVMDGTELAQRREALTGVAESRRRLEIVVQLIRQLEIPLEIVNHGDAYYKLH